MGGDTLYLQLIYSVVQYKATQHCKAIILQLKTKITNTKFLPSKYNIWTSSMTISIDFFPLCINDTYLFLINVLLKTKCLKEKAMAPHSSTPAWKIPWMEEPGRLQSMGSLRVGHD